MRLKFDERAESFRELLLMRRAQLQLVSAELLLRQTGLKVKTARVVGRGKLRAGRRRIERAAPPK